MSRPTLALALALWIAGCAASTRPVVDAEAGLALDARDDDAALDAHVERGEDARVDATLLADGAECRTEPWGDGVDDCRRFFRAIGVPVRSSGEQFICCAGRCFLGLSCLVEDPTRARCDLAERPCNTDELCCRLASRRYDCRSRANPVCNPPPDGF